MSRNVTIAGALVAASLTLTACGTGPTEPKPWPSPSASATAEVIAAAAESSAPAPKRFEWADVTGQGVALPRDVREHTMYSAEPIPGAKILHVINADDDMNACSIGPAVTGTQGRGFLTGAACTGDFGRPLQYLQTLPGGGIQGWAEAVSPGDGASVIWSSRSATDATRIAGTWPVAGVLTRDGVQQLVPIGSPVCEFGASSGVACGLRLADEGGKFRFDVKPGAHDIGAAVFAVDRATRSAVLIGVRASTGARGETAYLDPELGRLGAKVLLDSGTAALTGDGFSERVVK
ncbi:chymotrypsin family serine protease [Mycobacteroides abscessus]|uniref:hypothetical protein n=1 Tax=Mycobacteroides abscessus TaxID=36809 RepID=UPI0026703BCB|nr:hypothetical protein [Mycobacteroides abscessus]MDO3110479.1 hypothetical protein [Mycobacteroides abscessus subsp. abscessus]